MPCLSCPLLGRPVSSLRAEDEPSWGMIAMRYTDVCMSRPSNRMNAAERELLARGAEEMKTELFALMDDLAALGLEQIAWANLYFTPLVESSPVELEGPCW